MCLKAIGLGIAGAGTFLGAKSAKKGAKAAANAQLQATQENNALARDIYGKNEGYLAPYANQGLGASNALNDFLGLSGAPQGASGPQMVYDPGTAAYWPQQAPQGAVGANPGRDAFRQFIDNSDYGFRFGEGANEVNSGYAGRGILQSGAAMKGLEDYRQNLQSGYRNEFLNLLGNQQGVGLSGASALAGVGQNFVNTISANNNNAADARSNAALIKAQNNPFANTLGVLGGGLFGLGGGFGGGSVLGGRNGGGI